MPKAGTEEELGSWVRRVEVSVVHQVVDGVPRGFLGFSDRVTGI